MTTRACRRPINDHEQPHLQALGGFLRAARRDAGLTQATLAGAAQIGERHLRDLEHGRRRTRQSTLRRLAAGLAPYGAPGDVADSLTAQLVALAGPALAAETPYAERVAARRRRRAFDRDRNTVAVDEVHYVWLVDDIAERHVSYRRDSGRRWRRRVRYVLRDLEGRRRLAVDPGLVERLFDGRPVPQPKR